MGYQLGIHLGASETTVAVADAGWPSLVPIGASVTVPTVLHLGPGGSVGGGGLAAARLARTDPAQFAQRFVERLGDPTPILVGGVGYSASALVARYLSWLVEQVTAVRGGPPELAVVIAPGSWPGRRREALADALARVEADIPILARSTTDAFAALLDRSGRAMPGHHAGSFDLGTNWFEAAVYAAMPAGVLVTGGPVGLADTTTTMLDELLRTHVLAQAAATSQAAITPTTATSTPPAATPPAPGSTPSAPADGLLAACAAAREELIAEESTSIEVGAAESGTGTAISVPVTRAEYENLVRPMIEDSVRALARALRSVPAAPEDLSLVILRGPGARIPLVGRLLSESVGATTRCEIQAESDLALGAALLAAAENPTEPASSQTVVLGPAAYVTTPPPSIPPISRPPTISSPVDTPPGAVAAGGDAGTGAAIGAGIGASAPAPVTALTALADGGATASPLVARAGAGDGSRTVRPAGPAGPFGSTRKLIAAAAALIVFVAGSVTLGLVLADGDEEPAAITAADTGSLPKSTIDQHPQLPADQMRNAEEAADLSAEYATAPTTTAEPGANTVISTGSAEVAPITGTAYAMFREVQKGVTVQVSATDTDDGLAKLCSGQADIAGASFALSDPACKDKVVGFEIAHHLLPIVVPKANTWVKCLTVAQVGEIWKRDSTVTSWNQVDPAFPNVPVRLVGPGPQTVHAKVFLASMTGSSDNTRQYQEVELEEVAEDVEYVQGAIGFMDYANFLSAADEVRAIQIDSGFGCVEPNALTAGTGMYLPLCKPLYIYASKESLRKPGVAAFMRYYMENQRQVTDRAHFVARDDATIRDNLAIVNGMTAGVEAVRT
ncbi:phosphate ABC transporter substrate-binding protein [Frankia sp. R43]|uniref:substrate-binding domain-containing protein n=1 Tax=Frankia sp. R43 TaxID=269536 RepID=UPI0006CA0D14|nr:substrate-binding domain-containing protein [Frankia sp. R43]KPM53481.1 phosphate ABC transporter substrate-binding protein [Frankia sp. R43]